MIKLDGLFGNVSQAAIDLLVRNGAEISYDGRIGEFTKLPPNCEMGEFHSADGGPSGTRIHRNITFNGNMVDMGVSDERTQGQLCDYLKIVNVASNLDAMRAILGR
jgi:hypothetical protein